MLVANHDFQLQRGLAHGVQDVDDSVEVVLNEVVDGGKAVASVLADVAAQNAKPAGSVISREVDVQTVDDGLQCG